jgi:hypothetical protein
VTPLLKECFVCGATLTGVAAERGHGNGDCAAEVRKLRLVLGQSAAMCREHYRDGVRAAVARIREHIAGGMNCGLVPETAIVEPSGWRYPQRVRRVEDTAAATENVG